VTPAVFSGRVGVGVGGRVGVQVAAEECCGRWLESWGVHFGGGVEMSEGLGLRVFQVE